ncbi:MAG: universal stress protein [Thermoplasmata archaeon]|jgi:nucleotide-binding universal stress UspA family protein|nr:universal stress protein [Thermoplasmata archaeon]MVT13822.1 hypothetical protein [Euryarchaeota archaeon]MVT15227.1 hypothetical protein [Euryarchaeota archaeon]MVT35665.1 hypothetical protein [Euryarchaeota archaeon]
MNFIVAFDGSSGAVAASEFIKKFLKEGDLVYGLYVVTDTTPPIKANLFEGTRTFNDVESFIYYLRDVFYAIFSGYNVKFSYTLSEKKPVSSIILDFAAKNNGDVVVTGTRKLKGLERIIMGSVSSAIISESNIPVIVVPP